MAHLPAPAIWRRPFHPGQLGPSVAPAGRTSRRVGASAVAARAPFPPPTQPIKTDAPDILYDAVIIGGGMGGLTTAGRLAAKGAKVLVLEKYVVPGGSAAYYQRDGYTFDVGSSIMFGFGENGGTTNLIAQALRSVGKRLETVPDPTQVHYHLPSSPQFTKGLNVRVWRRSEEFITELTKRFPHERAGIKAFYDECWRVFNCLNKLELKSLEEPRYLLDQLSKQPAACLTLATYLTTNTDEVARRFIKDPELLRFIDVECFTFSTVGAEMTPIITAGMVLSDRHHGGIHYPVGGVGMIPKTMAQGIEELGGHIMYKANVKEIVTEGSGDSMKATGVRLADGRVFRGKAIVSNATRWDTFEKMLGERKMPPAERLFRTRYKKAPSFFSMHMGVKADVLPSDTDCHHILLDEWDQLEKPHGTLFLSIPSILDPSLAPDGFHAVHAFTPDWIDAWQDLPPEEYERKKAAAADVIVERLSRLYPGFREALVFQEAATPRTHRRFLNRSDGTYGPIPSRRPLGMVGMPFNSTAISRLYCVGDSTFPGQGVNAVVFSGFGCAHRVLCDIGMEPTIPVVDQAFGKMLSFVRDRV